MKSSKLIGILFISLSLVISSCKKKKDDEVAVEDPANLPLSIDALLQTSFTLDGTVISFTSANPDYTASNGAGGSLGTGGSSSTKRYYDSFVGVFTNSVGVSITKGTLTVASGYPGNTAFYNFFQPGAVSFSPVGMSGQPNGIIVSYFDGSTNWSTASGTGNQSGSNFSIVESQNITAQLDYTMKVYAVFNCKLYSSSGDVKTLTNGSFVGTFINI